MSNKVMIAHNKFVSVGDEVYIAVVVGNFVTEVMNSTLTIADPQPRQCVVKKMVVNSFDSDRIWLNEPGCKGAESAPADRILSTRKEALAVVIEYQEKNRILYSNMSSQTAEIIKELQKEFSEL